MKCMIFGAGKRCAREKISTPSPGDLLIAADGGWQWMQELGWNPDVVLGDFDSLASQPPADAVRFPSVKDDADMALAVAEGWQRGYRTFLLYGGTGGRPDHTMANYQLLAGLSKRTGSGFLVDDRMTATAITNGEIRFRTLSSGYISVFSFDETAKGVTIEGLKYSMQGGVLSNTRALGLSNEFQGKQAHILVREGTLLVLGEYMPEDLC